MKLVKPGKNSKRSRDKQEVVPVSAVYRRGVIYIVFSDGEELRLPCRENPRLASAPVSQRKGFVLSDTGIHWDELGEDLSFQGIREGRYGQKRGGARPGAGRKRKPEESKVRTHSVSMRPGVWEKLTVLAQDRPVGAFLEECVRGIADPGESDDTRCAAKKTFINRMKKRWPKR